MRVEVFERSDEMLVLFTTSPSQAGYPHGTGTLRAIGTIDLDPESLSATVASRLAERGYHVVAGPDGDYVRSVLYPPVPRPSRAPIDPRALIG